MKPFLSIAFAAFLMVAGISHFLYPRVYIVLIPPYLPYPEILNVLAGSSEIILGAALLIPSLRRIASIATILLFIVFIPVHIYFIREGSCIDNSLCVPKWIGWLRLVLIHPVLIILVYYIGLASPKKHLNVFTWNK